MREATFPAAALIQIRAEPGLRDAIKRAARADQTSAAEFLRRELRAILTQRGVLPALRGSA